jgi:ribosomal protein L11 methyltransferase
VLRLAVRVRRADAELVLADLLELAPSGVEEVDVCAGIVEYAVYGAPGELPALPDLTAAAGGALVEVRTSEIADDWSERWREFHRPLRLGDRLTVRPPWEPASATTALDVVIDPAQAFGTGAHATTRLCLELLLELAPGGAFVDLGCGSGVLAITAALLGWAPVIALDNDPAGVAAARANATANGVTIDVRRFDLRSEPLEFGETVAANLLGPLLLELAGKLQIASRPPQRLIASGLLADEADGVAGAFGQAGLEEIKRRERGGWAALVLQTRVDNVRGVNLVHRADVAAAAVEHHPRDAA